MISPPVAVSTFRDIRINWPPRAADRAPKAARWSVLSKALCAAVCALILWTGSARALEEEESIFQRFALRRDPPKFFQTMIEVPVTLHPQTQPDSETVYNYGVNWVTSFRPANRFYASRSLGIALMEWRPTDPTIEKVKVKTAEYSMILNHRSTGWLVTSFGLGFGMMDGLIYFNDDRVFEPRLEPFIPILFGLGFRVSPSLQVGLKYAQSTFLRPNPGISVVRVLLGIGYSY